MRLLLLEFFRGALRRNESSLFFPFLQGLARERGGETLWLCYGGGMKHRGGAPVGRALHADLPAEDLRSLARRAARFRPTHVVSNDALSLGARDLLAALARPPELLVMPTLGELPGGAPGEQHEDFARCGWFLDWLGRPDPAAARRYLVEEAVPDYSAVLANAAARAAAPQITFVSGTMCAYRRTLEDNPHYHGLDLGAAKHRGCAFCDCALMPPLTAPPTGIMPLLETQLRRTLETAGRSGRDKGRYEFFDIRAFWRFDELFALVLRLKLPPSVFLFNPRIDDVLRRRARIERVLPALAKAGHEVRLLSMGVENFSESENARFNKRISLEQVDEFLALAKNWGNAYPGVFRPFKDGNAAVELGFILFTPWTTLADVRLNLELAAARGFPECGYWLYSILLLEESSPIFRLAEKEGGVLAGEFPDPGQYYGFFKNEGELTGVRAWRFKDERVAAYFALLVRVCAAERDGDACAHFRGDPLFDLAARLYREANADPDLPVRPLRIALSLLEVMEAARAPFAREMLLQDAVSRASIAAAEKRRSAPGSPEAAADAPRSQLGRDGLAYFKSLIGGPPGGWELETSSLTPGGVKFSLVRGPRRLEFDVAPQGRGKPGARLRSSRGEPSGEDAGLAATIAAGLAATTFDAIVARLRRDDLLFSDPDGSRIPSRLERYYRVVDHSRDFWKFVYPQWRCLEEKVNLGSHWARINYATLECRLANPEPGAPSLRFFAGERPEAGEDGCADIETQVTEADVVGGRTQERLGRALEETARREAPAYIHLNTTCLPELIGDTPVPFMRRIETELGVPVFWTSKTRPGGPVYSSWVERLLDASRPAARPDPRAVLLAGVPSPEARAQAEELCGALGLRVVGTLFPDLDFRRAPEMGSASAVVWLDPVGWETIPDSPFLRRGLAVVRTHPPYGLDGSRAWLGRVASVLGLQGEEDAFDRVLAARAAKLEALRAECRRRTAALIGDEADLELLVARRGALGFAPAELLGELGFNVLCLAFRPGGTADAAGARRPRKGHGAGTIETAPFSTRAQLERALARRADLAFTHFNHDPRLEALGLPGFTEAAFEPGLDGLLASGGRLLMKCRARPFPRHRAFLSGSGILSDGTD
ncbi:MAG: hypothetical protein HYV14_14300 [Elusimicrobia bacterium]|nr:hypothetical protein [Elusimicrobiota bacterium]